MDSETFKTFDPMKDDVPSRVLQPARRTPPAGFGGYQPRKHNGVNASLPDALFNDIDPQVALQKEQPWHRQVIELAKVGYTNKEIAAALDRSPITVSLILRQPWARERLITEMKEEAQSDFKALLEAERTANLRVLKTIRDDSQASNRDRIQAATAIWDRDLGKPNQPLSVGKDVNPELLTDKEILEQLAASGAVSAGTPSPAGRQGQLGELGQGERLRASETSPASDSEAGSSSPGRDKAVSDIPPARVSEEHV